LEHGGMILHKAGWQVCYFGIESRGASNKLTFPEPLADSVTLWKHQPPGMRQKAHFLSFTLAALGQVWRLRPGWVYCSDMMSCPAAWLIQRLSRCRVVYHEHDSPETRGQRSDGSGQRPAVSRFQRMLLWFRREVGRKADLVVFPNAKRLELFIQECGRKKPSQVVFNCPRKEEAGKPKSEIGNGGAGELRLFFHGSLNYQQPPPLILEAMSKLDGPVSLTVAGYPVNDARDCMELFLQTARRLGLKQQVRYLGPLPRHELMKVVGDADVGLAMFPLASSNVNLEYLTGASNKPFDYLASGLALLVSARPDWEEMFVQPGYGLACDPNDAESIATQLRWFLEHAGETHEIGARGRHRVLNEWNYEQQFAAVYDAINH
jgi:glycosyltransferase involved in cell wall biosynthesis